MNIEWHPFITIGSVIIGFIEITLGIVCLALGFELIIGVILLIKGFVFPAVTVFRYNYYKKLLKLETNSISSQTIII
jgi:hypothetical protein